MPRGTIRVGNGPPEFRIGNGGGLATSVRAMPASAAASKAGVSAAGHAHVPFDGRAIVASVDDEVVTLGLATDGFVDGGFQQLV